MGFPIASTSGTMCLLRTGVLEIDASKIYSTNCFGSAVDLGIDVPVDELTL